MDTLLFISHTNERRYRDTRNVDSNTLYTCLASLNDSKDGTIAAASLRYVVLYE